eukprot:CAMPEP_0118893284 /NCGR_PEP_ID=MMETSP1166-20130328/2555_1 /TAXON_ID=1104430 /ORGANISM="Chrysoreinhardia sp, Strain CCMP3193" /LENGTH=589 /DNA_ID=CAMNT_0006832083 /DNA_START=4095 /DNA_END=5864 /DNA_ORIENTATION=+
MTWGMEGIEDTAEVRPEFAANRHVLEETSPVTGEKELYFPPAIARIRRFFSLSVMAACTTMVLVVVIIIFFIKAILTTKTNLFGTRKSFRDANVRKKPVRNWGILRNWELVDVSSQIAGVIVALLNAVQIFALENFFSDLAKQLTDYEAHRTDTLYEDSLTGKVFALQFINSFTSYMYIGFFKEVQSANYGLQYGRGAYACVGSCMAELRTQLGAIFISKVILANVKDIVIPYTAFTAKKLAETRKKEAQREAKEADGSAPHVTGGTAPRASGREDNKAVSQRVGNSRRWGHRLRQHKAEQQHQGNLSASFADARDNATEPNTQIRRSHQQQSLATGAEETNVEVRQLAPAEEQLRLEEYNILLGPFADYRDLVIIYGYTVLFVAAFPLAPLMALVNSYIQIRSDAWHISVQCRRPWPSNAEDIGTWSEIIELMSYLAVLINSVIVVYTGTFLDNFVTSSRLLVFIGLYHGLFILKFTVAILVDDVPRDVQIQLQRQHFVEDKLLRLVRDDVIEVEGDVAQRRTSDLVPDVTLHDEDNDVVYLNYPGFGDNYKAEVKAFEDILEEKAASPGQAAPLPSDTIVALQPPCD